MATESADKLPKNLTIGSVPIFSQTESMGDIDPFDRDWIKVAFMVPDSDIMDVDDLRNRYWSSADYKFTDTSIGGNIGINARPGFTPYADILVPGRIVESRAVHKNGFSTGTTVHEVGMGRAYSEMIDDPAQKIFLRFGVQKFNGLSTFLLRAFDREQAIMARTGRAPSAWYSLAKIAGTAIPLIYAPAITVTIGIGKAAAWLFARPTSKFFTIKPTMHMYWSAVNSLVMNHCVNEGLVKKVLSNENEQRLGRPQTFVDGTSDAISALLPDIFREGVIDTFAIATKAQRLANRMIMADFNRLDQATATDFVGYLRRDATGSGTHSTYISKDDGSVTFGAMINRFMKLGDYENTNEKSDPPTDADKRGNRFPGETGEGMSTAESDSYFKRIREEADALFSDGADFACFRVDHTGSVSESFGNTTGESEIAQKYNGAQSKVRDFNFNVAGGNLVGGTAIGDAIQGFASSAVDLAMGAIDGVTLGFSGVIPGLGSSGYMDIPKYWQSSSANLPRGSYTIQLISPYGNPISRLFNVWIPFYMLLAGVLPRSTGRQSYTNPFYCQLFDRGRVQIPIGMIERISITRGTSNLPFTLRGNALALDVSFDVVDLSTIMHVPMSAGKLFGSATLINMDEDNNAVHYLNTLAGMDIYSQIYPFPKAHLKLTKELVALKYKATSPAYHASLLKHSLSDGFLNDISFGLSGLASEIWTAGQRGNVTLEGDRS